MQDFKHILAWQRAHALAIALHIKTKHFVRRGAAGLRGQLTCAADSIAANIVEGCGAESDREFARYLDISIKSANETEYFLLTARDLDLFPLDLWQRLSSDVVEIRKMTYGYRKKVLANSRTSAVPRPKPHT